MMMSGSKNTVLDPDLKMPLTVNETSKSAISGPSNFLSFSSYTMSSLPMASPSGKRISAVSSDITTLFLNANAFSGLPSENGNVKKSKNVSDTPKVETFVCLSP